MVVGPFMAPRAVTREGICSFTLNRCSAHRTVPTMKYRHALASISLGLGLTFALVGCSDNKNGSNTGGIGGTTASADALGGMDGVTGPDGGAIPDVPATVSSCQAVGGLALLARAAGASGKPAVAFDGSVPCDGRP